MRMPERLFVKPLARALIEQRRNLALDANKLDEVKDALDAFMIEPELFTPELGHYLGMRTIYEQMTRAKSDDDLKEVVGNLWALAVTIEDGNISDVERALRAAQEALRQALERGASDEEIKKLTEQLRAALDNFMRQLAEQLKNNPQQLARPLDPNTRVMRQDDLRNMIDRMERLSRSGDKDAAKQLLDQLQQMLENLQMAQPGQGGDDMEQALNELGDVIRKQQQLRDRTFKEGQDSRRGQRGQRGEQNQNRAAWATCSRTSRRCATACSQLLDQLGKQGMRQRGQQGQQGQDGQQGQQGQQGSRANRARATTAIRSAMPTARWVMPATSWATATPTVQSARRDGRWKRCGAARRTWRSNCSRARATAIRTTTARPTASAGSRTAAPTPIRSDVRCAAVSSATISR